MSDENIRAQIAKLSYDEESGLVHDLWDETRRESEALPLRDEQRQAVERRLREHEASQDAHQTWAEVRREIQERLT